MAYAEECSNVSCRDLSIAVLGSRPNPRHLPPACSKNICGGAPAYHVLSLLPVRRRAHPCADQARLRRGHNRVSHRHRYTADTEPIQSRYRAGAELIQSWYTADTEPIQSRYTADTEPVYGRVYGRYTELILSRYRVDTEEPV